VYFINDDPTSFASRDNAATALRRTGSDRNEEDDKAQQFIAPPRPPFKRVTYLNGPIYSPDGSGDNRNVVVG